MTQQIGRRIAEGREAEIFAYGPDSVLKLFRKGYEGAESYEEKAMLAIRAAGGPAPEPRGTTSLQDRSGLIMERLDGPDMLTLLGKKPWFALSAGRILGETHAALHAIAAPPELPALKERFKRHYDEMAAEAPQHRHLADFATRTLAVLPEGDRLCHGDYHPGNVLITPDGPRVIDWPNAMRGEPHADVARVLLMFDIATLPPGSPTLVRRLEVVARGYIRSQYIKSYKRRRPLDAALLARWRIPVAAQRLHDGIDDEREKLLELLERAMSTTAS